MGQNQKGRAQNKIKLARAAKDDKTLLYKKIKKKKQT